MKTKESNKIDMDLKQKKKEKSKWTKWIREKNEEQQHEWQ